MFLVNGTCMVGGKVLYRIDDLTEGREGLDFLNNPAALVPKRELAEKIVALLNGQPDEEAQCTGGHHDMALCPVHRAAVTEHYAKEG